MKISALRRPGDTSTEHPAAGAIRGTASQDVAREPSRPGWRRHRKLQIAGGAAVLLLLALVWGVRGWFAAGNTVPLERLRIATVERGHFVRDVAAQGTVIAAVSPTLFASAPGTISYAVHAGQVVARGDVIATLDSPALRNEYERERANLAGAEAALARESIEVRRQNLLNQQQADLADVQIRAAERELARARAAWETRAIPERELRQAEDDVATARLNFEHAQATASLERDSLELELRTRRLERDRQALVVENLRRRVDELTVRSPVDGTVANLAQTDRANVAENAPLVTVVDLGVFEVEFQVAETYATEIRPGMAAEITLDGRTHAGTVASISPEVRQSQVTGRLKFAGEDPPSLRQNQRASVRIVLDERNDVLAFDRGSQLGETSTSVYVVRGERAVRVPVQLGGASISKIEALQGLEPGDRVIISDTRDFRGAPEVLITD
ncbi:MAG TPA: HlyD family efflux transporter periplasmic adaptor subunit [Steroidobacteraceae bacterium]|nr:HlyD family efflux transporter periplasmic adaptor subunit [Steroidobacteraceae bacterium]HNS26937.1 HlyD family efflux transporter periplasmic adaptor subunit [Steroidobacteraceae bacterium]